MHKFFITLFAVIFAVTALVIPVSADSVGDYGLYPVLPYSVTFSSESGDYGYTADCPQYTISSSSYGPNYYLTDQLQSGVEFSIGIGLTGNTPMIPYISHQAIHTIQCNDRVTDWVLRVDHAPVLVYDGVAENLLTLTYSGGYSFDFHITGYDSLGEWQSVDFRGFRQATASAREFSVFSGYWQDIVDVFGNGAVVYVDLTILCDQATAERLDIRFLGGENYKAQVDSQVEFGSAVALQRAYEKGLSDGGDNSFFGFLGESVFGFLEQPFLAGFSFADLLLGMMGLLILGFVVKLLVV